jgi:hypothetical protein
MSAVPFDQERHEFRDIHPRRAAHQFECPFQRQSQLQPTDEDFGMRRMEMAFPISPASRKWSLAARATSDRKPQRFLSRFAAISSSVGVVDGTQFSRTSRFAIQAIALRTMRRWSSCC